MKFEENNIMEGKNDDDDDVSKYLSCIKCKKTLQIIKAQEHWDFHIAMDLDRITNPRRGKYLRQER